MCREKKSENRDRKWYKKDRWRGETKRDKLIDTHLLRDWQKGRERKLRVSNKASHAKKQIFVTFT